MLKSVKNTILDIIRQADLLLLALCTVTSLFGVVMIYSATRYQAVGAYSGKETWIVMCVVNNTQAAALTHVIEKYPHTFAMMSQVGGVMGNFKKLSEKGTPVPHILDGGDGQTV